MENGFWQQLVHGLNDFQEFLAKHGFTNSMDFNEQLEHGFQDCDDFHRRMVHGINQKLVAFKNGQDFLMELRPVVDLAEAKKQESQMAANYGPTAVPEDGEEESTEKQQKMAME